MYGSLYVFAPAGRKRPCSSLVYKELKAVLTLKIRSQIPKKSFDLLGRTESLANDDFSAQNAGNIK